MACFILPNSPYLSLNNMTVAPRMLVGKFNCNISNIFILKTKNNCLVSGISYIILLLATACFLDKVLVKEIWFYVSWKPS